MTTLLLRGLAGLAIVAVLATAGTAFLIAVFDMQVEWAGSGFRPMFSFGDPGRPLRRARREPREPALGRPAGWRRERGGRFRHPCRRRNRVPRVTP